MSGLIDVPILLVAQNELLESAKHSERQGSDDDH